MKIRCKHLLRIPNERLQIWWNVLVVVRLFELVNGKRNGEKETSSLQKWSKISVPTVCDLYHVQVNCSARMHNNKYVCINCTATKLGQQCFVKLENLSFQQTETNHFCMPQIAYGNRISGHSYMHRYFLLICTQTTSRDLFKGLHFKLGT